MAVLHEGREPVDGAPFAKAEAIQRADELVESLASRAREKLSGGQFFTPRRGQIDGLFYLTTSPEEVTALFAPETMRAALRAFVAERAENLDTLPAAGRPTRLAEIDKAILENGRAHV